MSHLLDAEAKSTQKHHASRNAEVVACVEAILAQGEHADHPLRAVLKELYTTHIHQLQRLERVTQISDQYQISAHADKSSLTERFERSLKQMERITRISDRYQKMLQDLNSEFKRASTHDYLTALPNRRLIMDRLQEEAVRSQRTGRALSVVMSDIDHFKSINDIHGHAAGDAVLVAYSRALSSQLRQYDLIARWGGEEFLLLLPETPLDTALVIADRLRVIVTELRVEVADASITFSASLGVAEYHPKEDVDHTLTRADDALYEAKRVGRNQVIASPNP